MSASLFSLLSFIFISTFTPGPSNISCASTGVLHGYRNTINYQVGLAVGVFFMMLLSGWLSTTLLSIFPALELVLRYLGAGYILYLAFGILKATYNFTEQNMKPVGFVHGFMLQVLNPKMVVYAFTLFSAFLAPLADNIVLVALVAVLLAAISFGATSAWALFGTAIKRYLHNPHLKTALNIVLSLFLVYTAVELTGLI